MCIMLYLSTKKSFEECNFESKNYMIYASKSEEALICLKKENSYLIHTGMCSCNLFQENVVKKRKEEYIILNQLLINALIEINKDYLIDKVYIYDSIAVQKDYHDKTKRHKIFLDDFLQQYQTLNRNILYSIVHSFSEYNL